MEAGFIFLKALSDAVCASTGWNLALKTPTLASSRRKPH